MTKRRGVLVFVTAAVVYCVVLSDSALGQQFPRLQEENLAGQQVVLPDAAFGKVAVFVFGFSRTSQYSTGAWMKQLRDDFGKNAGVALYQLAVIEDAPRMIHGMIVSGMKKGTPDNERATFIPVVHREAELKKLVGYKEPDDAYIVCLDRSGKVAFQSHGDVKAAEYVELRAQVNALLK